MENTKTRPVHLRMPRDLYEIVVKEAERQHRTVSNYIIMVMREWTGSL